MKQKNINDVEQWKGAIKRAVDTEGAAKGHKVRLMVNGEPYELEINPNHTLAYTLRKTLRLTGTKVGCDYGACAACTVLINGKSALSCNTLTVKCDGKSITTIEGLEDPKTGKLHPVQQAFIDNTAYQCGFCTPGTIMSSKALLDENPSPTEEDVKKALAGHFCRCISHYLVIKAVIQASHKMEVA